MKPPFVLRIDDVGPQVGRQNRALQLLDVAESFGIEAVVAVSPCFGQIGNPQLDGDWRALAGRLHGHKLALHGTTHRCFVLEDEDHQVEYVHDGCSIHEYACRDYGPIPESLQTSRIEQGVNLLFQATGQKTDVLVPPAHYFDDATLDAMRNNNFAHVATYDRFGQCPWRKRGVTVWPCDVNDHLRNMLAGGNDALWKHTVQEAGQLQVFWHASYPGFEDDKLFDQTSLDMAGRLLERAIGAGRRFTVPGA